MTRFRTLLWPTLFTVPVLLALLALGSWQIERLFWKRQQIAERQAAVAAAPVAAPRSLGETRGMEFRHVIDEGVFLHDKEIFLGATSEAGRNGYQVLTPLREAEGRNVFVNRGFIPAELKDPVKRSESQIAGTVLLTVMFTVLLIDPIAAIFFVVHRTTRTPAQYHVTQ